MQPRPCNFLWSEAACCKGPEGEGEEADLRRRGEQADLRCRRQQPAGEGGCGCCGLSAEDLVVVFSIPIASGLTVQLEQWARVEVAAREPGGKPSKRLFLQPSVVNAVELEARVLALLHGSKRLETVLSAAQQSDPEWCHHLACIHWHDQLIYECAVALGHSLIRQGLPPTPGGAESHGGGEVARRRRARGERAHLLGQWPWAPAPRPWGRRGWWDWGLAPWAGRGWPPRAGSGPGRAPAAAALCIPHPLVPWEQPRRLCCRGPARRPQKSMREGELASREPVEVTCSTRWTARGQATCSARCKAWGQVRSSSSPSPAGSAPPSPPSAAAMAARSPCGSLFASRATCRGPRQEEREDQSSQAA